MIKLYITKQELNPDYEEKTNRYNEVGINNKYNEVSCLAVEITQEQFEAIRKAVLDKF